MAPDAAVSSGTAGRWLEGVPLMNRPNQTNRISGMAMELAATVEAACGDRLGVLRVIHEAECASTYAHRQDR